MLGLHLLEFFLIDGELGLHDVFLLFIKLIAFKRIIHRRLLLKHEALICVLNADRPCFLISALAKGVFFHIAILCFIMVNLNGGLDINLHLL